jgi:putative oxygen-independent coproporphyrinogen III oxidase
MDADQPAPLGLYVHIPFCSAICNYCNFNRGLFDAALKGRYVQALITEIRGPHPQSRERRPASHTPQAADTIFFGGGTPSLLEPPEIAAIIGALRETFAVASDCEVTLEANPETIDREKLERFRGAGVNRLSFGVQSFHDAELRRLGRIHSAERARQVVGDARAAGYDNVSLDLMMWLPGQSVAAWLTNVDALIAAEPDHASLYLLELYPNAPLKEEMARGGWSLAPDDDAADMYLSAMERLDTAGLVQYEISNVARPGRQARHNLKYWTDGAWLGFGCGAHSTRDGVRWKNVAGTAEYVSRVTNGEKTEIERRVLTNEERLEEALFTGLRLTGGIDAEAVGQRYNIDVFCRYGEALAPFVEAQWLIRQGGCLRLTRHGMLMANEVMAVFV